MDFQEEREKEATVASWKKAFQLVSKWIRFREETELIDKLMDDLLELTHAERGFLVLKQADEGKVVSARGIARKEIQKPANEISWTITSEVLQTGEPVVAMDALNDRRFQASESVRNLKLKSILCLPLKSEKNEIVGAAYLDNRTINDAFTGESREMLDSFCELAAAFLQNIRVVGKLEDRAEMMAENCRKLISDNTNLNREKRALEAQLEFHVGQNGNGAAKKPKSLGAKMRLGAARTLLAFLAVGSFLWNGCGSMDGGGLSSSAMNGSGNGSAGKNAEPVPIFGGTSKNLTLSASGMFSGEYAVNFDTIDLTVSGVTLIPKVDVSQGLEVSKSLAKSSGEIETFTFDSDPFTVRVLDSGQFLTADIVSLEVEQDSYESVEVTFSDMTVTGDDGSGNTFTATFNLEGSFTEDNSISFSGTSEQKRTMMFDFHTVARSIEDIINNLPYKNFGFMNLDLKNYTKDLWKQMNDAFHVAEDLNEDGLLSDAEFAEFQAMRLELRQTLNDLKSELRDLQQDSVDTNSGGSTVGGGSTTNNGNGNNNTATTDTTTTATTTTDTTTTDTTTNSNSNGNGNSGNSNKGGKKK